MALVVTENKAKKADMAEIGRMLEELEAITDEQAREIVTGWPG